MAENVFLKPKEFYQREINPIGQYVEQTAFYLHKMSGKDLESCKNYLKTNIQQKRFEGIDDPRVNYFERNEVGDRYQHQTRLSKYINDTVTNKDLLAPTFTTYLHPSKKKSLLVDFIDGNVARRAKFKKEAAVAKAKGLTELAIAKDNDQANMKMYNNSMSGSFSTKGCILNNPTGHSTLTSITRTMASLGNASNEKIIAGNRHYHNPDVTLYNVIAITSSCNKEELGKVLSKYNLYIPTYEDVEECIKHSSNLYWRDEKAFKNIRNYIFKLDDIERAAVVYTGDFWHIRKHNELFVRDLLVKLSKKVTDVTYEDPIATIKSIDEMVMNYTHQICMQEVEGIAHDYSQISIEAQNTVAATGVNVTNTVIQYKDLISAIFLTKVIPASTAHIPNMIRSVAVLSDTDSTIFAIDEWVQWYFGDLKFTPEAFAVAGAVMYIATESIAHCLAVMSANIGVDRDKLFQAKLKPEFVFPVFVQTPVAKHYFTCALVKEGSVYKDIEMEIKGVGLKNSAAPKDLVDNAQEHMEYIIRNVLAGKKFSIINELKRVANIERKLITSLLSGDVTYYKSNKIKDKDAYTLPPERSPYQNHVFWVEVFEPKYGTIEEPTYDVIKIPVTTDNPTRMKQWLAGIKDRDLADRMTRWLTKLNKKNMSTMYLSTSYVRSNGIPEEIVPIINIKKSVLQLTSQDRMILESLGYFPKPGMLISDLGY